MNKDLQSEILDFVIFCCIWICSMIVILTFTISCIILSIRFILWLF